MGGMSTGVRPLESGLVVFILPGVVLYLVSKLVMASLKHGIDSG